MTDNVNTNVAAKVPTTELCKECGKSLCLRQTVVNYALGNDEDLYCLSCLGAQNQSSEVELVTNLREYILGRECFSKEWKKYPERAFCPCPMSCIIDVCFGE